MIDVNWNKFKVKNPHYTNAFEKLCYEIFCRKYGVKNGIGADFNHAGLEAEPILNKKDNKYYGFQSKFFEKMNYTSLTDSINKALQIYTNKDDSSKSHLHTIVIFLSCGMKKGSKSAKELEKKCSDRGVQIEWFLENEFYSFLNQPNNLDLANFYFNDGDKFGYIADSKSIRLNTLIQSDEYIELSVKNGKETNEISKFAEKIIHSTTKLHLLCGNPGSGKSVCMTKFYQLFAATNYNEEKDRLKRLKEVGAITTYINLNSLSIESLENTIRQRQNDFNVRRIDEQFIYLLDGLDEVPESKINLTISFLEQLSEKSSTKFIVVSCRTSSPNKFKLKMLNQEISENTITNLSQDQIQLYFKKLNDDLKIKKLQALIQENKDFVEDIQDMLTLSLLWKEIDNIDAKSSVSKLIELNVNETLSNHFHNKYLNILNIPIPKIETIIQINKAISYHLFESQSVNISQKDLYNVLLECLPRADYVSLNNLVGFLSENYFDVYGDVNAFLFAYRHRRFSEYFLMLDVIDRIREDILFIRKKHLLINQDFFYSMLIPYLKDKALQEENLNLSFALSLVDVYRGVNRNWGVDDTPYIWSEYMIYTLCAQEDTVFNSLMDEKSLIFKSYLIDLPDQLKTKLKENNKKRNFDLEYLNRRYFKAVAELYKTNKFDVIQNLELEEVIELQKKEGIIRFLDERTNYDFWKDYFYTVIVIGELDFENIKYLINNQTKALKTNDFFDDKHTPSIVPLLKALTYVLTKYKDHHMREIILDMNDEQLKVFSYVAIDSEISLNITNSSALRRIFSEVNSNHCKDEIIFSAYKKIKGLEISQEEQDSIVSKVNSLSQKSFLQFTTFERNYFGFLNAAIFSNDLRLTTKDYDIKVYSKIYIYYQQFLQRKLSLVEFTKYCTDLRVFNNNNLSFEVKKLLGFAFSANQNTPTIIKNCIAYLKRKAIKNLYIIYFVLKKENPDMYNSIVDPEYLLELLDSKRYIDISYESTGDSLFIISFLLSDIDIEKSYETLYLGIENALLRMNQRKDYLLDEIALKSFELLINKNWLPSNMVKIYCSRLLEIMDELRKNHIENDGYFNLLKIISEYNIDYAFEIYCNLLKKDVLYNDSHSMIAKALISAGKSKEDVGICLSSLIYETNNFNPKGDPGYYEYNFEINFLLASSHWYDKSVRKASFECAMHNLEQLKAMDYFIKLDKSDLNLFESLSNEFKDINIDLLTLEEKSKSTVGEVLTNNLCDIEMISTKTHLKDFFDNIGKAPFVFNAKNSNVLIEKLLVLDGNLIRLIDYLRESRYPDYRYNNYSTDTMHYLVAAAFKNSHSRYQISRYLLENGGGHDGYFELIQIYSVLGDKEKCRKLFNDLIKMVELLVF